jgi:hypothetical protein
MSDYVSQNTDGGRRTKVDRLIDTHDLEELPLELEQAWVGENGDRQSLRELARRFNERLVRSEMRATGMNPLDGEAANVYDLLVGEETTGGAQVRAERRLDREGVDVDSLRASFVSHQAIHTYLTTVRGLEHTSESTGTDDRAETVQRLLGRTRSVSTSVVAELEAAGDVDIGEFELSAAVHVTCRDCTSRYELTAFLDRGHCDCDE